MSIIHYFPDPLVSALAWSLIHSLWQILIIGIIWKSLMLMLHQTPTRVRQNISFIALLSIPVVFATTLWRQYSLFSSVKQITRIDMEGLLIPTSGNGSLYMLPRESTAFIQTLDNLAPWIFWIYWCGLIIMAFWFLVSWFRLQYVKRTGLTPVPEGWISTLLKAYIHTGLSSRTRVWLSDHISVPAVVGFFKPVVLFPIAVASSLSINEVEEILLHEFYHIRCNDHFINAIQHILEVVFLYHPLVWHISATLRTQREARVDEWVVSQTRNPFNYANTLLNLEEKRVSGLPQAVAATSSAKTLLFRIKNIMHMKTRKFNPGQKIVSFLVIALAAISIAWLNPPAFLVFAKDQDVISNTETAQSHQTVQTNQQPVTGRPRQPQQTQPMPDPTQIVLDDGSTIAWAELSEQNREEIRRAMQEMQVAIGEAIAEVNRELNSPEFKAEIQQVGEEIGRAMDEVKKELTSTEFKQEMQQARHEIRRAMEEIDRELNSEEFKAEMRRASEEVGKALESVGNIFTDEEFKAQMREVPREVHRALKDVNWNEVGNNLNMALQEFAKTMETMTPTLNEAIKNMGEQLRRTPPDTLQRREP